MEKISKRNQDPKQVEQDAAALALMREKKSAHFAVGTGVLVCSGGRIERAEVLTRPGNGYMLVRYEDDTMSILRPPALAWERT